MSLPQYETCCTGCDEKWGATRQSDFLEFLYVCWCYDCNYIAHAEDFEQHAKKRAWYIRHIRRLIRVRFGMSAEILMPPKLRIRKDLEDKRNNSSLEILREFGFLPPKRITLDLAISELNSRLSTSTYWLDFITNRKSPPKCLSCGGSNFQYINTESKKSDIRENSSEHPGCGGKLYEQESGWRLSIGVLTVLYDIEGNRIDSDRAPWRGRNKFQH